MAFNSNKRSLTGRNFHQLMEDFSQKASSFENPGDFLIHLNLMVNMLAPIRICLETGVFRSLESSDRPLSSLDLAKGATGSTGLSSKEQSADQEEYMGRMLRAVAAINLVDEVGPDHFQANEITRTLAQHGFEAGFREMYDNTTGPRSSMSAMLDWGKASSFTAPQRSNDGPYQRARDIVGTNTFAYWVAHDPESLSNLSALMKVMQRDRLNWIEWFPAEALFDSPMEDNDRVCIVDVGGGWGQDASALARRYPKKQGRFIVEDLPLVIAEARAQDLDPRIELVEHDFFCKQPVRGANIYFMHKIMHDWADADCVDILTHLRDAMGPNSRIFINDVILLDQGNPLLFTLFDIGMFVQLGAKERNETMWSRLISKVGGLQVRKFWQAPGLKGEGIVEVVRVPLKASL